MDVKIINDDYCHEGFFKLRRMTVRYERFDGAMSPDVTLECLERGNAAAVLLYDPDRDRLVLIRQFRIGSYLSGQGGWTVEIVAGGLKPGADPAEEARREVLEETGYAVSRLEKITEYALSYSGGTERITLYLGIVDSAAPTAPGGGLIEEHEDIQVESVSFDQAWAMMECGEIDTATVIIALQWLKMNRERLRR